MCEILAPARWAAHGAGAASELLKPRSNFFVQGAVNLI
jgi:hypothetical protein